MTVKKRDKLGFIFNLKRILMANHMVSTNNSQRLLVTFLEVQLI
jgi:hypothetical protein